MKIKEKEKENCEKLVESLLENYNTAMFNKDKLGGYYLKELLPEIKADSDEDTIMECLNYSVESLKEYPKKGQMYYDIIKNLFMESRTMNSRELAKKYDMSVASIYSYKASAIQIISQIFSVAVKTQGGVLV